MYRKDWSEKPSLKWWKDLVLGQWRTRIDEATPANGEVVARGHRGRYLITATHGGKQSQGEVVLDQEGSRTVLTLR